MGHDASSRLIFVGLARLPQSCSAVAPTLAVEVAIELPSRRIVDAHSTLQLPGLSLMLRDVLVGTSLDDARKAVLNLEVRYSAPFTAALSAAIERALQRAKSDLSEAASIAAAEAPANADPDRVVNQGAQASPAGRSAR